MGIDVGARLLPDAQVRRADYVDAWWSVVNWTEGYREAISPQRRFALTTVVSNQ
jgi:hypothetical protein